MYILSGISFISVIFRLMMTSNWTSVSKAGWTTKRHNACAMLLVEYL